MYYNALYYISWWWKHRILSLVGDMLCISSLVLHHAFVSALYTVIHWQVRSYHIITHWWHASYNITFWWYASHYAILIKVDRCSKAGIIRGLHILRVPYRNLCIHLCISIHGFTKSNGTCHAQGIRARLNLVCKLPMKGRCAWHDLYHMTFDLDTVTLTINSCAACCVHSVRAMVSVFGLAHFL